ncbi:MAG: MtnX-like HAD-IB family phosphatase [Chloroflexi bacterium]|nr:MtnX-like HAD-IB family phosphatase [Chloroflexota bacterium]
MAEARKTLVQCDFEGTCTEEDVSYLLLDAFANGNWRGLLKEYEEGRISVGRFNSEAFAMVKADRQSLLKLVRSKTRVRPGFAELVACCRRRGFRFVVVSNGLDFYIREVLGGLGMADIEVVAAQTRFHGDGLDVQYLAPDGTPLDEGFKETYVNSFLGEGYRLIYVGNGASDMAPARQCHYIFATDVLLAHCQQANFKCTPFTDFNEVVSVLESW